jgi:hypothetical protein
MGSNLTEIVIRDTTAVRKLGHTGQGARSYQAMTQEKIFSALASRVFMKTNVFVELYY